MRVTPPHSVIVAATLLMLFSPSMVQAASSGPAGQQTDSQMKDDIFNRFDRNQNQVIDQEEFPGDPKRFLELDKNGDGVLSREELRSDNPPIPDAHDNSGSRSGRPGPPPDGNRGAGGSSNGMSGGPGDHGGGPGGAPPGGEHSFDSDDKNGDGKVSRDEFSGPADLFEKLDKDGDGYLSREEGQPGPRK